MSSPTEPRHGTRRAALRRLAGIGIACLAMAGLLDLGAAGPASATTPPSFLTTSPLPPGTVGVAYSEPLVVTGGTAPYTFVFRGKLPPGLRFSSTSTSALISGTPTIAGTANFPFGFNIVVRDSGSPQLHGVKGFFLNILNGAPFAPGTVLAFGGGPLGNAAPNSPTDAPNPVSLPAGVTATYLSLGVGTGYALTSDGHVYAWGENNAGQLGNGSPYGGNALTPVEVCAVGGCGNGFLSDIVAVSSGGDYTLFLTSTGSVLAVGVNDNGQLGNDAPPGSQSNVVVPVCAVGGCSNGNLSDIKAVSAGPTGTSLALTDSGAVLAWGVSGKGQQGNGIPGPFFGVNIPVPVCAPAGCSSGNLSGVSAISSGGGQNEMALTTAGQVLAWGNNFFGQLGNGTTTQADLPTAVSIPTGTSVRAISAGGDGAMALSTTGTVLTWGYLFGAQPGLGNGDTSGSTTPVALSGLPPIAAISAGSDSNSMVLTTDGVILGWGNDDFGQLGVDTGSTAPSLTPVPVVMPAGTFITAISSGTLTNEALVGTPLSITTSTLPAGTIGASYSAALAATGGTPPYTFSLAPGAVLPTALALNSDGAITGTPSVAGTTNLSVEVTDSEGRTATKALRLTVGATSNVTGTHRGPLVIGPGSTSITDASIDGPVVLSPGASVSIVGSHIHGAIASNGATSLAICSSEVTGSVSVTGSSGFVLIGDAGDDGSPACAPDTISGTLSVAHNTAGVEIAGAAVHGTLELLANTGAGPNIENAAPELEANHVDGLLSCSVNSPAPVDDGQPNTTHTGATGQCAGLV